LLSGEDAMICTRSAGSCLLQVIKPTTCGRHTALCTLPFSARDGLMTETDSQTQKDVIAELEAELGVGASMMEVSVNDGAVMLSGTAASYTEKYAAERAALRVPGVRAVSERLQVAVAHGHVDDEIAIAVAHALWQAPSVPANIQATVEGGWVTLLGEVIENSQSDAALDAVRQQAGTERISNLITVKPSEQRHAESVRE
jgi:osmotically-inducible protein OsmY